MSVKRKAEKIQQAKNSSMSKKVVKQGLEYRKLPQQLHTKMVCHAACIMCHAPCSMHHAARAVPVSPLHHMAACWYITCSFDAQPAGSCHTGRRPPFGVTGLYMQSKMLITHGSM
jgi:hypothetical protein